MSFQIIFKNNTSEFNALNKNLTTIQSATGTLRDQSSIIRPEFMVEGDINDFVYCNYLEIPIWKRSYFIDNITAVRNGIFRVNAHVDPLETYKKQILNLRGIVARNAYDYDNYLTDSKIAGTNTRDIKTTKFSGSMDAEQIILVVANV